MTHDPRETLCSWWEHESPNDPDECECDLIATVRSDERERIARAIEAWPDDDDDTTTFSETMPWIPQEAAARIVRGEQ